VKPVTGGHPLLALTFGPVELVVRIGHWKERYIAAS
jgi:hypothetical protein